MRKTKTIKEIEEKMSHLEEGSLRYQVLQAVRKFKGNWLELGRYLTGVKENQSFRDWGYSTWESYCTRELKLRQLTIKKLILSYYFLEKEEPEFVGKTLRGEPLSEEAPDYESIDILRKARSRSQISNEDYEKMREAVFRAGVDPRELGRQYRVLLAGAREAEEEPEEAWTRRRRETVKRMLGSLKSIKNTLENYHFLSDKVVGNLKKLIKQIEDEIMQG